MNEYDSEIVKSILEKNDYCFTEQPDEAHAIFLNTCSVRENAHEKVKNRISYLKHLKKKNKKLTMGVLGCMAQSLREELLDDEVGVDIVAGPDSYKKLPDLMKKVSETGEKDYELTLSEYETYSDVFPKSDSNINAWIAVMRGCDNFCSFCIVPYTRGRERSREPLNVVKEVEKLVEQGIHQVTLLGQNVNSYQYENYSFANLIEMVSEVKGIERIRFTSPHPKDFPEELIDLMAKNPKVCKHIHLPLQAGNSRVLDLMNRTYTKEAFLNIAFKLKKNIPNLVLTTDIIVGFPTETEEEFLDTLDVIEKVEFDSAFMFKYSERPNTIASRKYEDDVPEEQKADRLNRLIEKQLDISLKRNLLEVGKEFTVLVEREGKKEGQLVGRNDGNKNVAFIGQNTKIGDFVKVIVEEASSNTLIGRLI
jgi:tRNA-2-methylthio-N6-dimethylallyladenosine synthase